MLLRLLRDYLLPYKRFLVVIAILQLVSTSAFMLLPSLNADIIDKGVAEGDTGYIMRIGAIMLGVAFVQILASIVSVYFAARSSMSFGRDLRAAIFAKVGSFSAREVGRFGAPSLITRTTNDVQQVQMLAVLTCTLAVMVPMMMVGGVAMAI
ncbi:MAG TPA: ABC transporter transmembrane domain-containing protein, partial [Nocardioides sp.]